MLRSLLLAAPLMLVAAPAFAQDADAPTAQPAPPEIGGDSITIGVGGVTVPQYEGANKNRFTAAPLVLASISGFNFTLIGNSASLDLIPDGRNSKWDFQAGPVGVYNFNRDSTKSIDDPRIKALGRVKDAIELGGFVGLGKTGIVTSPYDKLSVSLSYRHDVSGANHSHVWSPTLTYFTPLSRYNAVSVIASADRAGSGYAETYFSVSPTQSLASGLPIYYARGGWKDYSIALMGTQAITGDLLHGFKIVGGGIYRRMLNDFGASPITMSKSQWTGAVGLAYTFK